MNYKHFISKVVLVALVTLPTLGRAQSKKDVLRRLESTYKSGAGVEVAFALADKSKITMTLATDSNAYTLKSKTEEFICDGTTQWHIFKADKKVVIDNVSKTGTNSQAMLDFINNYDADLQSPSRGNYTLKLTPHANVASLFKAVGDIQTVTFTMIAQGGGLVVQSISAEAPGGTIALAQLKITPKKRLSKYLFTYKPLKSMQVVDLRE